MWRKFKQLKKKLLELRPVQNLVGKFEIRDEQPVFMPVGHTDAVVSFESFRALKLTLFESFRVLKSCNLI